MTVENVPSNSPQKEGTPPAGPGATSDPSVDAILRRAAHVQSLPLGEQQRHYGQLLEELTAELQAGTGPAAVAGQGQP